MSLYWRFLGAFVLLILFAVSLSVGIGYSATLDRLDAFGGELSSKAADLVARQLGQSYTYSDGWETLVVTVSDAGTARPAASAPEQAPRREVTVQEAAQGEMQGNLQGEHYVLFHKRTGEDKVRVFLDVGDGYVLYNDLTELFQDRAAPDSNVQAAGEQIVDVSGDSARRAVGYAILDFYQAFGATESQNFVRGLLYTTLIGGLLTVAINTTAAMETPGIMHTYIWELEEHDSMAIAEGHLELSVEDDTITLSGKVPGITAQSRLAFGAFDHLGGIEEVGCFLPSNLAHEPFRRCTPYDVPVRAGNSVADDLSDVPAAHIDITAVDTSLSGETLTAVFHLRDVPETLTFDSAGVPDDETAYRWLVLVDADNDPETGFGGIDYTLSAARKVSSSSGSDGAAASTAAPGNLQVSTRKLTPGEGFAFLADSRIELSAEDNTLTLSGEIPGITTVSPLAFEASDYSGGTDKVGCLSPVPVVIYEDRCDSGAAMIAPGQTVTDAVTDTLPAHMDITEVSTTLTGETLAVVFHLRDIPETLEFNREGVRADMLEYGWSVSIDVDNDRATGGYLGDEYTMSASRFVHPSSGDAAVHLPIEEAVQIDTWKMERDGSASRLGSIDIAVSPEDNTITLTGDIPGITPRSRLAFEAYDFLHGHEQLTCRVSVNGG